MTYEHKQLAAGRWFTMPFREQMANLGSEVERAIRWKEKGNDEYSQKAAERMLELLDITIEDPKNHLHLKELTRLREALVDYFFFQNQFASSNRAWRSYFYPFNWAARLEY